MIILSDIDGTVADNSARRVFIERKPKNWKAYNAGMEHDKPITPICELLRTLYLQNCTIIFVTGREEIFREVTEKWLRAHRLDFYQSLIMREEKDYRDDAVVKSEFLEYIRALHGEPSIVLDDRKKVVDMWRAQGIKCLQVEEGNF